MKTSTILLTVTTLCLMAILKCTAQAAPVAVSTDVPVYEYQSKVIIEGKWGSGPGEFGWGPAFLLSMTKQYKPTSLAVDSAGNIYILDIANNRIQKFDKGGKYLISIPVDSFKGHVGGYCVGRGRTGYCNDWAPKPGEKYDVLALDTLEVEGINIVIDSKDNLYYYLKRTTGAKETGEVWQFKDDKLVGKKEVPVGGSINAGQGLVKDDSDDSVWIFNIRNKSENATKSHEVKENKNYTKQQRENRNKNLKPKIKEAKRKARIYIKTTETGINIVRE